MSLVDYLRTVDHPDYAAHVLFCLCADIVDNWDEPRVLNLAEAGVMIRTGGANRQAVVRFHFHHGNEKQVNTMQDFQRFMSEALQAIGCCVEGLHHFYVLATDPNLNIYKARRILQGIETLAVEEAPFE